MQRQRGGASVMQSSSVGLKNPRFDSGPDPYLVSAYPILSPHRTGEGSGRGLGGKRSSPIVERRDYDWHLGQNRSNWGPCRLPLISQVRDRPAIDERVMQHDRNSPRLEFRRRYELPEAMRCTVDTGIHHGHGNIISPFEKDMDFSGCRFLEEDGLLGKKPMILEEISARGPIRMHPDFVPHSNYREVGRNLLSSSNDSDMRRFRDESKRYPYPLHLDKFSGKEPIMEGEEPMLYRTRPVVPVSQTQSKDFTENLQFKYFGSTSLKNFGDELSASCQEHLSLPYNELPSRRVTEMSGPGGYGPGSLLDCVRDPRDGQGDLSSYSKLYPMLEEREIDDYRFSYDGSYHNMLSHAEADYVHRDLVQLASVDHLTNEVSHRSPRNSIDLLRVREGSDTNHCENSRVLYSSRNNREYLDSDSMYVEFRWKTSQDRLQDRKISHLRQERAYGAYGGNAGPDLQKDSLRGSFICNYDQRMHEFAVRQQISGKELPFSDSPDHLLKRQSITGEDVTRPNTRKIMSGKWKETRDLNDRRDEWIDEGGGLLSVRRINFDHIRYKEDDRIFDAKRHHRHAVSDWLSYPDPPERGRARPCKPGGRHVKGHLRRRPGSESLYNSYKLDGRSHPHKFNNVWKRIKDDDQADVTEQNIHPHKRQNVWKRSNDDHEQNVDPSGEWVTSAKSELPEDSEEFNELVHEYFLKCSRKLNEKPAVQRRYKEQGKVGNLFCVICDRSLSKEFMETKHLATHAFMSQKPGLRAQHLGLHKAICVLMGWNSVISLNAKTWAPQVLPSSEGLAQKEDLVLWPPLIIIHNTSISNTNPEDQKVFTVEMLEAFLRGKGLSGGRPKVSLGNPSNRSVLLVKFLGTSSGMQDAERLHDYFAKNKRGRTDFAQIASTESKVSTENFHLYGYMGIAEDLDEVDGGAKKMCTIRSKKEMRDFISAPIRA